jgi:hypothetical protein
MTQRKKPGPKPSTPDHLKRVVLGSRLPQWLVDALRDMEGSNGDLIETALIKQYNLKPPK